MLGGGDFTPPKTSSKEKAVEPPEPLLAEPAEPLGFLRLDCTYMRVVLGRTHPRQSAK